MNFTTVANQETLDKTVEALKANGVNAIVVETGEEAKKKALELLPKGAEVMTMTSVTLSTLGISDQINDSGDYDSVKNKLNKLDRAQLLGFFRFSQSPIIKFKKVYLMKLQVVMNAENIRFKKVF